MKAVIYARYSSDNQREESIEGQLRENKAFAEKNGIEIIGTYIDRALSAKTDNRPEFRKMIDDSSKGLFDIVIVWKLDRFARNRYDSAYYKAILKKNNVKVVSATENISEGADGVLLEAILEGFAEYYSAELAEKIKRGLTENALKLRSNGVRAPIGYYVDDEKHFQIDENNAPIIKDIFMLYNDGKKVSEIVELMKSRGIKNRGNFMNYNAIFRILTNRKYIGEYKFGDILVPNAFPAIIDEGLFNAVQDRMKRNKKAPAMHRSEDDYLLTTHLFCGKCGAMMTGEIGTSHTETKYRYYKCNQAKKKKCDKKTVRKEWLENLVIDTILELITDDSVIEELAERVFRFQDLESAESILLKTQLEEVEKKLNNLAEAMAQGIFSATTKKLLDDLEAQKKTIETDIIQYQIRNPIVPKEQLLFALYNYRKLDMSVQSDRQKLIDSFVNSIYLYDDYFIITFNYKNKSKKVSLKEINSSSLTSSPPPEIKKTPTRVSFLFLVAAQRINPSKRLYRFTGFCLHKLRQAQTRRKTGVRFPFRRSLRDHLIRHGCRRATFLLAARRPPLLSASQTFSPAIGGNRLEGKAFGSRHEMEVDFRWLYLIPLRPVPYHIRNSGTRPRRTRPPSRRPPKWVRRGDIPRWGMPRSVPRYR